MSKKVRSPQEACYKKGFEIQGSRQEMAVMIG